MGGEILAVTGSQSPALLSSARRSVLDRATAPQSSALRNPDTRWGSHGDLRPLMGAEVVTPEEPHPSQYAQRRHAVVPGVVQAGSHGTGLADVPLAPWTSSLSFGPIKWSFAVSRDMRSDDRGILLATRRAG